MSPLTSPAPSLLIEQLRALETQLPPSGIMISSLNVPEHAATVNQILTNARLLRERLAADSTEAGKRLSAALLDAIMYAEQVENANRLLTLADSCVGQIQSRMRAYGIPIQPPSTPLHSPSTPFHPPSMSFDTITAPFDAITAPFNSITTPFDAITTPDVNGPAVQGPPCSPPAPMAQPNAHVPPNGFAEYLAFLAQNGFALVPSSQPPPQPTPPTPAILDTPDPPTPATPGRILNRAGRGTGGVLVEKERISKEITAPARKRKSTVDADVEAHLSSVPEPVEKGGAKQKKRIKTLNLSTPRKKSQKSSQGVTYPTPTPDASVDPELLQSPISTPAPPTPIRPTPRLAKPKIKVEAKPLALPVEVEDDNSDGSDGFDSEIEVLSPPSDLQATPVQPIQQNPMLPGSAAQLLQACLHQMGTGTLPFQSVFMPPPPVPLPPPANKEKPSKGIRGYPETWQEVLNDTKVAIRAEILIITPFPSPHKARTIANERFHEVHATKCNNNLVLDPRFSWGEAMMKLLLNEISTCRSEVKKLAQILVGSDPSLFPSSEVQKQIFQARSSPEIRTISAKAEKTSSKSKSHDPNHVRTSILNRIAHFGYLNDPPTAEGNLFANPILEKLCKSFYEEDKWRQSLSYLIGENEDWSSTVTCTMVSLAGTAYRCALEEWQTGHYVQKKFEADRYTKTYTDIYNHVVESLNNDNSETAADGFSSWAVESAFVQELLEEAE